MAFLMERLRPAAAKQPPTAGLDVPGLRNGLLSGAVAAGAGLAFVALPILLLWIVTPYAVTGPGGVVHLAACLWLLAHGAGLVRPATYGSPGYGGAGVPLAVTPLLVSVLVLVPLYRAGVRVVSPSPPSGEAADARAHVDVHAHACADPHAVEAADADAADEVAADAAGGDAAPTPLEPSQIRSALLGLGVGYLLVAAVVVATASTGSISVSAPLGAFGCTALVSLLVAALGVRRGAGPGGWGSLPRPLLQGLPGRLSPRRVLPSGLRLPQGLSAALSPALRLPWSLRLPSLPLALPSWLRLSAVRSPGWVRAPGWAAVAVRAALGGGTALLGAGGTALLASLLLHLGAAGTMAAQTAPDLAGRLALLLLCAAVLPNAAVWGAAYAVGPGFAFGGWLGPLGGTAGALTAANAPAFPLFTVLPSPGRTPLGLLTLLLPLTAGLAVAAIVGRTAAASASAASAQAPVTDDLDDPYDPYDLYDPYERDDADSPGRPGGHGPRRDWGPSVTALVALVAALGTGLLVALVAAASGGALGTAVLAQVGPSPWRTGVAALAWTAAVGVPGAVLLRWRIGRRISCRRSAA